MKKAKYFIKKTTIFFVGLLTVLGMSGLPTLAAVTVTVSTDVVQIKFDQEVDVSGSPSTNWELAGAAATYKASDLRSYYFESPIGTYLPLSRFAPYSNTTEQGAWTSPTFEGNILNFNLQAGQSWELAGSGDLGTNPIYTVSPVTEVGAFTINSTDPGAATVSAARAPSITNVYDSANVMVAPGIPAPYALAAQNTEITIKGLRFGVATWPQVWFVGANQLTVDSYTTETVGADIVGTIKVKLPATLNYDSDNDGDLDAVDIDDLPAITGFNRDPNLKVINMENVFHSTYRPLYLYNASYGVLYGKIVDKDADATPVDKVTVTAYQPSSQWNQYQGKTQANGYFAIVVPAGTYNVEFKTPGSGSTGAAPLKKVSQVVTAGSATNVGTITFTTAVITGYICDPYDASTGTTPCEALHAIYGATIKAHDNNFTYEQRAETGVDGSFKLYVTPNSSYPQVTLEIELSDYNKYLMTDYFNSRESLNVTGAGPYPVKYKLPAATTLVTGTVMTANETVSASNPLPDDVVPGANVHLFTPNRSYEMWTQTNDLGKFTIGGAPAGTNYSLEIEPPPCNHPTGSAYCIYSRTSFANVIILSGQATNLNLSSACASGGAIRFRSPNFFGHVYADADADNAYDAGEGIANVWVQMDRSDGFFTGNSTDASGSYSFYLPNTGVYHLNAFPPSDSGKSNSMADVNVSVLPITSAHNIKLGAPNVSGFVYAPGAGTTAVGGWIQMEPQGGPGQVFGSQVDNTTGAFGINVTTAGTYSLRFDPQWGSVYTAPSPYTVVIAVNDLTISSVTKGGTQDATNDADCDVTTKEPWCNSKIVVRTVDPATDPNGFKGTVYGPTVAGTDADTVVQQNINIGLREANSSGMSRWTQTNNLGTFTLSSVTAGSYELEAIPQSGTCNKTGGTVNCSRYRQIITVTGGAGDASRNKTIHLTTPGITGTIATPYAATASPENPGPDTAVPQAWVSLNIDCSMGMCSGMGGGGWYGTNAGNDGTFGLGGVVASSSGTAYRLEIEPPRWLTGGTVDFSVYSRKTYSVTLYDANADGLADTTNLNTALGTTSTNFPGGAIRVGTPNLKGKVLDPAGNALPWVWVMVHDSTWMNQSGGNTNNEGIFTVGGLSDGAYMLEINMPNTGEKAFVPPSNLTATISGGGGTITGTGVVYDSDAKVYKITMTTPLKTISGYVYKDTDEDGAYDAGEGVQFARVEANRDMGPGHFETKTDVNGHYSLLVSQGAWWLNVMPSWEGGNQPDWVLNQPPLRVEFTGDNTVTETSTQNFTVQACDSTITGRVMTPGATSQAVQWAWVQANGNMNGMMGPGGNGSSTDNQGYFTMKVPAGTYQIMVFPNTQNYGSPTTPTTAKVASGTIKDVGTIFLTAKDAHIKGTVQDNNGNAISNVIINAFQMGASGWANTYTDQTGAYDLLVTAGTWNLMVMPMSSDYIYQGAPKQITVDENQTSNDNNFLLKLANRTIKVKVVDSTGTRITNIFGGVWVKDTSVNDMLEFGGANEAMMQKSGMMDAKAGGGSVGAAGGTASAMGGGGSGMAKGGFTGGGLVNGYTEIKVPAGTYELGLGMPPGSDYILNATKTVTVSSSADPDPVELVVTQKNATIIGYFYKDTNANDRFDPEEIVTGIRATIHANKDGGGWSMTESNPTTGSYSIKVSAGDWFVDAFIDPFVSYNAKKYMIVADDIKKTVTANSTADRHLKVKELDSTISGHVFLDADADNTYDAGEGISNAWVFITLGSTAMMDEFKGFGGPSLGAFSDANGAYTISVAAGTYKVGAGVPPGVDLINPQLQTVTTSATTAGTADLQFKNAAATISGYVYIDSSGDGAYQAGEEITSGFVRAWSNKNSGKGAALGSDKTYSIKASLDDTWHLEATAKVRTCSTTTTTLCTADEDCPTGETCTGAAKFYKGEVTDQATVTGTLTYSKDLKLVAVTVGGTQISIPESKTVSFDAADSKTIELSDGLIMEIPAQSIASSGTVTVSINPVVDVKAGSTDKPITFGYDFTASITAENEATGQYTTTEKESDFSSNITITFPYNETLVETAGYTEDEITPQYYDDQAGEGVWKSYNNVVRDTANDTLTVKTDHFSTGGITGATNATGWVSQVTQQAVQQAAAATTGAVMPIWQRVSGPAGEAVSKVTEKVTGKVAEVKEKIAEKIVEWSDGELVKSADSPAIYLIKNGKKIHIPTWEAFVKAGFKMAQVKVVESSKLVQTSAVNLFKTASDPRVFTIKDGKKFHIPSLAAFAAQGFDWKDVTTVSAAERDIYPEITLIKTADSPNVFYISKGLKRLIPSAKTFEKSGYKWQDISTVSPTEIAGAKDTNLIKQVGDPKVYRIESDGTKRWIKTESAFKNLGYDWKNIMESAPAEVGAYPTGTTITK